MSYKSKNITRREPLSVPSIKEIALHFINSRGCSWTNKPNTPPNFLIPAYIKSSVISGTRNYKEFLNEQKTANEVKCVIVLDFSLPPSLKTPLTLGLAIVLILTNGMWVRTETLNVCVWLSLLCLCHEIKMSNLRRHMEQEPRPGAELPWTQSILCL